MNDLISTVDWSRAQFALTAMYHWLFVPLTIGMSLIVAIMETIYLRTKSQQWLAITKFWMTLFGINFACGVATGIILEFEFGTNWSNYSWFVGDIFGAPLAIEGIVAFFMEATFIAVMFFGWKKVSPKMHLAASWLTAIGVTLSALWILVANAWMQYPVGMKFDPADMRCVMDDFFAVALSPMAINKFTHTVSSSWVLGSCFVIGISCWLAWRGKQNQRMALNSVKVAASVGLIGIILTIFTGDTSAVEVGRRQPMKLAAMEGLYDGAKGQGLVAFGLVNTDKRPGDDKDALCCDFEIPGGLALLARHDMNAFVPGINDIINGVDINAEGDTINTVSYAERMVLGRKAIDALKAYDEAAAASDTAAMNAATETFGKYYQYFGYGYLDSPEDAVPPVATTFYSFRIMVMAGGALLLILAALAFISFKRKDWLYKKLVLFVGMLSIPLVWICSEAGWVVAEVGRQPWIVQDKMPCGVAVSSISAQSVQITFWVLAAIFTLLLIAEVSIMLRYIGRKSKTVIDENNDN